MQKQLPELTTIGKRQKLVFVKFFRLITPIILNTLLHTSKISKKRRGTITLYYATSIKKLEKLIYISFLDAFFNIPNECTKTEHLSLFVHIMKCL